MKIENSHISNRIWIAPFILAAMIATYTLIIGGWSVDRFNSFNATLWDMGIMVQSIWNTAHGSILHESVNLGYSVSRLAMAHWELIYFPLAIIYRIIPSVPLLLYIQSFVLACGMIPIYRFAKKKLSSESAALLISLTYLFYPALHGANLFDLHGLTFATTFLLFTFYYLDKGDWIKAIILGVLSICCREDVAFVIFTLGIYNLFKRKPGETIEHGVAFQVSAIFIGISLLWITAFFSRAYFIGSTGLAETNSMVPNWKNSIAVPIFGFLKLPLPNIISIIQSICSYESIKYIAKLILPTIGLCCLSPSILLISLPTVLLNLSSNYYQMRQIEYHYTAAITPFIFFATINGMANLKQWSARLPKLQVNRITFVFSSILLLASVISTTQFSILRFHKTWRVSEDNKKLSQQLRAIPSELSVSASARVGAHLANRKELYHFPEHDSNADLIILEFNRPEVEIKNLTGKLRTSRVSAMNQFTQRVFQDTTLGIRFIEDNVFCFQRGLASKASFEKFCLLEKMPSNVAATHLIDFGNGLHFLAWKSIYIGNQQAHFQLFWSTTESQPETTQLNFYLASSESQESIPYQPVLGKIPINEWEPGKIIADHLFINRPGSTETKTYSVIVSVFTGKNFQQRQVFKFDFR